MMPAVEPSKHPCPRSILVLPLMVAAASVSAHPHMWIDTTLGFRFAPDGLAGLTVAWTFDELNSASMLEMYDTDGNGALSRQESETTRVQGFEHLYDIGYFVRVEVDGIARKAERATEFIARVDRGLLIYSFYLPLRMSATPAGSTLGITVVDESFFVDFTIPENGVTAGPPTALEASVRRVEKPQTSAAGWSVMLQQVQLTLRKRGA